MHLTAKSRLAFNITLFILLPLFTVAQKTDLLILKNGDHITGEVKKLEYGVLNFDTDDAGLLTIKWKDVMKLRSPQSFELTTENIEVLFGSLDTTWRVRQIKLLLNSETRILGMDSLVRIVPIKKSFLSRMDGSINTGLSYSKGSEVIKFNFNIDLSYRSLHDLVKLVGYSEITRQRFNSDTTGTTRKQNLDFTYYRYFKKRWIASGYGGVEQTTELGLDARIYIGAGGGKGVVYTNLHALNVLGGIMGNREYATTGGHTNNAEAAALLSYRIYKYTMPKIILTVTLQNYYSLNNPGRIRLDGDIRIDFELVDDFTIGFSNYHDYDNRPPSEGASQYDWGVNTTIGYTF